MLVSEWKYLKEHKMILVVLVAIALIPAIYCFIYLSSMWNTYGKMDRLPVAVVNHDRSVTDNHRTIKIGEQLTQRLVKSPTLDFHQASAKDAAAQLRHGKYYMVLTIPKNFSREATTIIGATPQKMALHFTFNSGQNFIASKMTTGAATAIKANVSAQVTKLYSTVILNALAGANHGMSQAAKASITIAQGTQQLSAGENKLVVGAGALHAGIGQIARANEKVIKTNQKLSQGSAHLAVGAQRLMTGTRTLETGTGKLASGSQKLAGKLNQGAKKLQLIHTKPANADAVASPVHEVVKDISKVPNNGTGMAPFAIAIGLYVGAIALGTMYDGFLPHKKPRYAMTWWGSKASVIGAVGLLQTVLLFYSLTQANRLKVEQPVTFFIALLLGSLLFLSLIFCLRLLLGGFGTWLVSIVLVLQLAASGGLYPTYLTNSFAKSLNEWLPMTYLINALRNLISTHQGISMDFIVMIGLILLFNLAIIARFKLGLHQSMIEIEEDPRTA